MSEIVAPIITDSTGQAIATAISGAVSKADKSDIAPEFSTSADYAKGSMVYYQGTLYEFTAAHNHVAWTGSDVIAVKVSSEIDTLKSGLNNNMVSLTTTELFQIINQGSHYITSKVLHVFAKIKCVALPAEGVNDIGFVILPSGNEIHSNQRGIVINIGKASGEWAAPSNLVYGYISTSDISGHTSDLTVGSYYLVDVIIRLAN